MATPIFPIMDDAYQDFYAFYVPNRLTWEHWKEFMGENTTTAWTSEFDGTFPQYVVAPATSDQDYSGTLLDYLGFPIDSLKDTVTWQSLSALPFRGYNLIWSEWFRDENLTAPALVDCSDGISSINSPSSDLISIRPVSKYHDYFTSALPQPQKGSDILIPFISSIENAPLLWADATAYSSSMIYSSAVGSIGPHLRLRSSTNPENITAYNLGVSTATGRLINYNTTSSNPAETTTTTYTIDNGYIDLSPLINNATINDFRQAYAVQCLLENDARGGTRYAELLKSHFGVTAPDASLQRPELLAMDSVPISISQVVQQSSSDSTSPLGNVSGLSRTPFSGMNFTKSFTEHGFIFFLTCIRYRHSYQQGIEKMWSRNSRYDFYFPELANLGDQAILNKEIYATGTSSDSKVFGYQERWAEYRYKPNRVSGSFRYGKGYDAYTFADYYSSLPTLSSSWIAEDPANIDNCIAINSDSASQFLCDCHFSMKCTRPMPIYSIPGLSGHF